MSEGDLSAVRIDKWLWAVRICKTRIMAADLCQRHKVSIDKQWVKPSREVRPGQIVYVRKDNIEWQFQVLKCIEKRVGAQLASQCRLDLTPKEEMDKLNMMKRSWTPRRAKGTGRPTKKDRRALDRLLDDNHSV